MHNRIAALKDKKSKLSEEEWESILVAVLLATAPDADEKTLLGVEAVARLEDDSSALYMTIQRRIEGITV